MRISSWVLFAILSSHAFHYATAQDAIATIMSQLVQSISLTETNDRVKHLASKQALNHCLKSYKQLIRVCPQEASAGVNVVELNVIVYHNGTTDNATITELATKVQTQTEATKNRMLEIARFASEFAKDTMVENSLGPQNPQDDPDGGLRLDPETEETVMYLGEDMSANSEDLDHSIQCEAAAVLVKERCIELKKMASPLPMYNTSEMTLIAQQKEKACSPTIMIALRPVCSLHS